MQLRKKILVIAVLLAVFGVSAVHAAGIPVIDSTSIAQDAANFIQQMQQMLQQYQTMQAQLQQQVQHFQAITGSRGMGGLLSGQNRNYIPEEWKDALAVLDKPSGGYSAISSRAQQIMDESKVMSDDELTKLGPTMRELVEEERRSLATQKALSEASYNRASERFSALQTLTSNIDAATDEKAILDLQARIQSEEAQLKNESIKLQSMSQAMQIENMIRQQKKREAYANAQTYAK